VRDGDSIPDGGPGVAADRSSAFDARGGPQSFDRVLSSMCTVPHPAASDAAQQFLATNPGDPGTYGTVADLEREVVATLAEIAGAPDAVGYVTSGGTESNLQAVRAARERAATRRPNVVLPDHAHFSFHKAAAVLDVEPRVVPTTDRRADPDATADRIDADTVCVVAVAGSTEYGRVDPIPALAELAADAGARCHVDAAWGGFHLPFTDHDWSFTDAPVDTITIDPHKAGRAVVPAGGFLARDRETMDALAVDTPYLETPSQASLTGTRSGAGVAGAAAALDALWPDGYREQHDRATATADWLAAELRDRGYAVVEPELPIVAADLDAVDALRDAGWRLARTEAGEARIVCMPHVTRDVLTAFLDDLDRLSDR
jgi:tyrosine decarboxylase/aspartate 1-decarboxylase